LRNDLRVWDAKTGQLRFKLLGNGKMGGRRQTRFTPDGQRLIAWGDDELVRVWNVRNGKLLAEHSTREAGTENDPDDPFGEDRRVERSLRDSADIRPDGATLALGSGNSIRFIDTMTGKELQKLDIGENRLVSIVYSPDGKQLAVACQGKQIETKLPDGSTQWTTETKNPVSVWDLATRKPIWTGTAEGNWPRLASSPDGSRVAVVSNVWKGPSRVWVWDATTGKEIGRITLTQHGLHVAFDRTGKRLAVALQDTTAIVYDLETALKPMAK